ncbi:MAG: DUF5671 domain-containing protein [Pseudomonadales bacterium]|nr:hypothetical protein [Chloroflexota bacterium]MCH2578671.1 DUF5671 domain-containing protein [Pseudomonadales bacterium]
MGNIAGILFGLIGLAIPILIIAAIVYFVLRIKSGISLSISYKAALRVYFYIVILVSVGLTGLGGVSTLINVGLGEIVGHEFSYGEVYQDHRELQDLKNNEDYVVRDNRSLSERLDLEMKGNLINGISLAVIGAFLMLVHFLGRRWVETADEHSDLLRRLYLIAGLAIFAVITIVSLIAGIPETLRYALLEIEPGQESPGEALSIAIVGLPIWVSYLVATLRNVRSQ